jgi:hypothetical protein
MSLWTKFRDTAVRSVAAYYTGGASEAYFQAKDARRDAAGINPTPQATYTPSTDFQTVKAGTVMRIAPGGAAVAGRVAGRLGGALSARGLYASAMSYCRRHPAWCSTIGIAGVVELIQSGSLPPIKRRRRRGISASDLSKFRRVAGFLYKWGPMCATGAKPRARTTRARC